MRAAKFNGIRRMDDERDILVTHWEIENEVIQVLKPMYRATHDYIRENGWAHPQSGDEIIEDLYWERWDHNGQKNQWIWWRFKRDLNEYVRFLVLLDWQTLFVKADQKLLYKGKKPKGQIERINLIVKAKFYLQFDISDRFQNSIVGKFKKAFFNRVYQQQIEQQKEELLDISIKLNRFMKSLMAVEKEGEWPAGQYGPLGYGGWGDDTIRIT